MVKIINEKGILLKMHRVSKLVKRKIESTLKGIIPVEATGMQILILRYIHENEGADIFQRDIEKEFGIRRSTATQMLNLMEKNDAITRVSVEYDGRLKKIVFTKNAKNAIKQALSNEIENVESIIFANISGEEIKQFSATLDKIKDNLK